MELNVSIKNNRQLFGYIARSAGISEYVTPEMFGAKGDGVTDDTVAVQAAFTAAKAKGGVLLRGNYAVSQTINAYGSVETLNGASIKAIAEMDYVVIYNPDDTTYATGTAHRNLQIAIVADANNYADYGIGIGYVRQSNLNLVVINAKTYGVNVGYRTSGNNENLFNIRVNAHSVGSIGVVGNASDNVFGIVVAQDFNCAVRVDGYSFIAEEVHSWPSDYSLLDSSNCVIQIEGGGNAAIQHFVQDQIKNGIRNNSVSATVRISKYDMLVPSDAELSSYVINSADNPTYSLYVEIGFYSVKQGGTEKFNVNFNNHNNFILAIKQNIRESTSFSALPAVGNYYQWYNNQWQNVLCYAAMSYRLQIYFRSEGLLIRKRSWDGTWTEQTISVDT